MTCRGQVQRRRARFALERRANTCSASRPPLAGQRRLFGAAAVGVRPLLECLVAPFGHYRVKSNYLSPHLSVLPQSAQTLPRPPPREESIGEREGIDFPLAVDAAYLSSAFLYLLPREGGIELEPAPPPISG